MKTIEDIHVELVGLEPEFAELKSGMTRYMDVCQKLIDNGKKYENAVADLNEILTGKSKTGIKHGVSTVRFTLREQGLLLLNASRQLSCLSAKCLALSEKTGEIISSDS